ncbi:major facilitator superfamily domain-containing protein 6-like [Osmerus mordax]|uniref:major facilitator superfamily domain-containing protein 6-like n=1 Tax=Osmerus mordax TaxID=8014 RepID=UPI003510B9EF
MRRNQQVNVRATIALASAFHFLFACARACALPFLTLYLRHLGLSPAMVGICAATRHLVSLMVRPLGCVLAGAWGHRRLLGAGSLLGAAGAALIIVFLPTTVTETLASHCNLSFSLPILPSGHPGEDVWDSGRGMAPTAGSQMPLDVNATLFKKTLNHTESVLIGSVTAPLPQPHPSQPQPHPSQPQLPSLTFPSPSSPASTLPFPASHFPAQAPQPPPSQPPPSQPQLPSLRSKGSSSNLSVAADTRRPVHQHPTPTHRRAGRGLKGPGEKQLQREIDGTRFDFLGGLKSMDAQHQLFFLLLMVLSLWEACSAPLEWMLDDGLHEFLDSVDASDRYGDSGVWGLLGGACGAGSVGLLVSQLGCLPLTPHSPRGALHFYSYTVLTALALPLVALLPLQRHRRKCEFICSALKPLRVVWANSQALLLAAIMLLAGAAQATMDDFLLWAIEDQGGSELQMGLALGLGLLSKAAYPLLGPGLAHRLSPGLLLGLGLGCSALQALCFSLLWSPWAALPTQTLCCLSSGAIWWTVGVQVGGVASPREERVVRRLYEVLALDLGAGLGSLAGGVAVQRVGVAWMFRGAGLMLVVCCVCLPLLWKAPSQRRINYSRLLAAGDSELSESESELDWLEKAIEDDRSNNDRTRRTAL